MIKAAFFDIDGTLYSHQQKGVPASAQKALLRLKEMGIKVFVASGRSMPDIRMLKVDDLPFDGYVTINGQFCFDESGVIYDCPIHPEDAEILLRLSEEQGFPLSFVEAERIYINFINDRVRLVQDAISTPVPEPGSLREGLQHRLYQIIPYVESGAEEALCSHLKHSRCARWHPLAIDIISNEGGKERGISEMLKVHKLLPEEIIAFGDGENDIGMLELAGISVAMGNAADEIKTHADFVTRSVEEDGIFYALSELQKAGAISCFS